MGIPSKGVLHHTAETLDLADFELEGKPGPKRWRRYQAGRATKAEQRVIRAYELDYDKVVALERAAMRRMQKYHMSLGWIDIGYHRVIFPSGHVYEGRPIGTLGAHARNGNKLTGYSFSGNYELMYPTEQAIRSFREQLRRDGTTSFVGHFQVAGNATACPGKHLKQYFNLGG